ncbi:hypothetical protein [Streptomyces sp. NPDC051079]|uniref:hypothetical protein n=1 Tax=Streptomyces sp. NPDC051079 TaxID=3155043 RepID=UPI00344E8B1C
MARGRLRIYLGAAPGVGKTYAMLEEGQRRSTRVVGAAESPSERNPWLLGSAACSSEARACMWACMPLRRSTWGFHPRTSWARPRLARVVRTSPLRGRSC